MATLSELVDAIAAVEGIDPATVTLIARYVREAGLISTGGRGPSAAAMGLSDAANLLIGVNATTTAAESARTVSANRELEVFRAKTDPRPAMKYGTLGEAIEQLLHAIGVGKLPDKFLGRGISPHLQEAFSRGEVEIDLKFRRSGSRLSAILRIAPRLSSTITPATADGWQLADESGQSILIAFYAPRSRRPPGKKENTAGDRMVETTIGYRTLNAVSKLLQPYG
jgi:hypothetical protein